MTFYILTKGCTEPNWTMVNSLLLFRHSGDLVQLTVVTVTAEPAGGIAGKAAHLASRGGFSTLPRKQVCSLVILFPFFILIDFFHIFYFTAFHYSSFGPHEFHEQITQNELSSI